MNSTEIRKKVAGCKALQGKSVGDILSSPEFLNALDHYFKAQVEDWRAMRLSFNTARKLGGAKGMKVPSHVLDKLVEWPTARLVEEYAAILEGRCDLPANQREYIGQIGMQAYNYTIGKIVCAEFPELEEIFFPKTNKN